MLIKIDFMYNAGGNIYKILEFFKYFLEILGFWEENLQLILSLFTYIYKVGNIYKKNSFFMNCKRLWYFKLWILWEDLEMNLEFIIIKKGWNFFQSRPFWCIILFLISYLGFLGIWQKLDMSFWFHLLTQIHLFLPFSL